MNNSAPAYMEQQQLEDVLVITPTVDQLRDSEICYSLRDQMIAAVQAGHPRRVVIDMQKVDFVSSIGVLAFLNLRRSMTPPGQPLTGERIVFCNLTENLTGMFQICKMIPKQPGEQTPFASVDTLQSAIATA